MSARAEGADRDVVAEAEAALEDGENARSVARRFLPRADREGRIRELRGLCNDYSPGAADGVFAEHYEDGPRLLPASAGGNPSAPLSELYEALEGSALEYDLRPYTAKGRFTLLSAPPKQGKSTFAALYAHAKATGGTLIGQELEPSPVLYVAPDENWRDVVRRFRSFGTPGDTLEVWRDHDLSIARIASRAEAIDAGLVVLDTLLRVAGISDENDNAEWDAWFREAREHVHDSGAVWLALHHDRKSGGQDGKGIRGASAIFGGVDVAVSLQGSEESPNRRTLRVEGTRLDHAEPLVIKLDESGPIYQAVGQQQVVSILKDAALERLRDVLTYEPRTVSEVCDQLRKKHPDAEGDVPESTVRNRLERLRSAGLAARHGDGGRRDPYRYSLGSDQDSGGGSDARSVAQQHRDAEQLSVEGGDGTLNRSKGSDKTTERVGETESTHADTRSTDVADPGPSTSPESPRSIVQNLQGVEELSVAVEHGRRCACETPITQDRNRCDSCRERVTETYVSLPDPDAVEQIGDAHPITLLRRGEGAGSL